MYSFVAKEIDYASYFQTVSLSRLRLYWMATQISCLFAENLSVCACVCLPQLIEVQAEYHRKSLELLQSVLPQIKAHQGEFERSGGIARPTLRLVRPAESPLA